MLAKYLMEVPVYLLIFGSDEMAKTLAECCRKSGISFDFHTYEGRLTRGSQPDTLGSYKDEAVIVHLSNVSDLNTAVDWSVHFCVPMIQGSVGLMSSVNTLLVDRRALVIEAADFFSSAQTVGVTHNANLHRLAHDTIVMAKSLLLMKKTKLLGHEVHRFSDVRHLLFP